MIMRHFFIFLLFGITLSILFSSGQIENPDTHLRLTQTRIILNHNKFGLDKDVGENSHGNIAINDDGKRYMVYNPGQTIMFIPIYYIANLIYATEADAYYFSAFCASFLNYIIHALCAFILFKIALILGSNKKQAYLVSIFFGLTSYSFVFAQSTYEHHLEMLFILLSAFFSLNKNCKNSGFLSGLMLSLGIIFRTTVILALPSILLVQKNNKERLCVLLGLFFGIAFILSYNFFRFENAIESGYTIAWTLAHSNKFDFWNIPGIPYAFFGFLFSPGKGLFFFSTTAVISFLGVKKFYMKDRRLLFFILLLSATYLIFFSANFAWHGSIWSYGPRYILPIIPFLYLPIIHIKVKKWVYLILTITFILQIELISVNYKRDVLSDFITYNGLSDIDYIYSLNKEPHIIQAKQLKIILPKNLNKLNDYTPNTPWKKEARTASNIEVLNSSIEKNSINFWWVRVFHFNTTFVFRFFTIILLLIGLIFTFILFKYVKREFT